MAEEWKRAKILLEEIKSNVKAIAEGHLILDRKIDTRFDEIREKIEVLTLAIKDIGHDLREHIRQTVPPAHVSV